MNAVLSFLISAGIIAFGLWIITYAIDAGSRLGFTLMDILPIAIGSMSLYGTIREVRLAPNRADPIKQKRYQAEALRIARAAYLRPAIAPASRPAILGHRAGCQRMDKR